MFIFIIIDCVNCQKIVAEVEYSFVESASTATAMAYCQRVLPIYFQIVSVLNPDYGSILQCIHLRITVLLYYGALGGKFMVKFLNDLVQKRLNSLLDHM